MRVKINKYKDNWGPYHLAEAICFWVKAKPDEYGIPVKPKWVFQFGEWLAHGNVAPDREVGEETILFDKKRKTTWLYKFLLWISSKKKREISVRIDPWDTWSMDVTLGYIIRPMLKQLKETKHGSPWVDDEDVPQHLRSTSAPELTQKQKDTGHVDNNHHLRWEWALDQMIFAFESLEGGSNSEWEDQFTTGEYDFRFKKIDEKGTSEMIRGPDHTAKTDWNARKEYEKQIQNGFRLFGKYYSALWD